MSLQPLPNRPDKQKETRSCPHAYGAGSSFCRFTGAPSHKEEFFLIGHAILFLKYCITDGMQREVLIMEQQKISIAQTGACPVSCVQYMYTQGAPPRSWHSFLEEPAEYISPQCQRPVSETDTALCSHTGLSSRLLRELRALACRSGLRRLVLFGSRARGDHWRASDIDLAAEGGNIDLFASDADELTLTPLKYDVLDFNKIRDAALLSDIAAQGIILYEKT